MRASCTLLVLLCALSSSAEAHTRSRSYSSWRVHGDRVHVRFSVSAYEVTRLPLEPSDLDERLAAHLDRSLSASLGDAACASAGPAEGHWFNRRGQIVAELRFSCPGAAEGLVPSVTVNAFFDHVPGHLHLARVHPERGPPLELLLTSTRRSAAGSGEAAGFVGYLGLGVTHIVGGLDHLAFLLALLLLCRRLRDVVLLVTGFTLGHSITLGLVVVEVVAPDSAVIESLIGFTVALVAIEAAAGDKRSVVAWVTAIALFVVAVLAALVPGGAPVAMILGLMLFAPCYLVLTTPSPDRPARWWRSPAITVAFGLIHGFGFGAALGEAGLPQDAIVPALVGFNLGVELGQLAVVAGLAVLGLVLVRVTRPRLRALGTDALAASLCGLGVFWFVSRAF